MVEINKTIATLQNNIASAVFGKSEVIRSMLVTLLAGEHLLLEDVPGIGKTLLGRALAKSLSCTFHRIQFTPDLIPADITGGSVFDPKSNEFRFVRGPVFAHILLADEINRTTPRTQSAMLEAMSERQVSCDGVTYDLPKPFMVIATENPIEFEGTYPLPESQLDRFLMRISVGYPDRDSEREVLARHEAGEPLERLESVLSIEDVCALQEEVRKVRLTDEIRNYILDIAEATRRCEELFVGVSPRGSIALSRAAQSLALLEGRDYVVPDDVKQLAVPVLAHRVIPKGFGRENQRGVVESLIERLLDGVIVPG